MRGGYREGNARLQKRIVVGIEWLGSSNAHRDEVVGDGERSASTRLDVVHREALANLNELKALVLGDVKDRLFGDDAVDAALAGQGQAAVLENLVRAVLGAVLHRDDDARAGRRHKVH